MPVLRREVLAAIEGANRGAYQVGASLAKELRGYAKRAGRLDGCDEWLRQVRADNKRRRALQEEFTRAGLPARAGHRIPVAGSSAGRADSRNRRASSLVHDLRLRARGLDPTALSTPRAHAPDILSARPVPALWVG
jgi:hypothetical protein